MGSKSSTAVPMEPLANANRRHDADAEGEDLISGLPDELLHAILVRLPSAMAAARTSVLSRRWRSVWAHMPDLVIRGRFAPSTPSSALLDAIDGAISSYAAPTLHSLEIGVRGVDRCDVHGNRIDPLLRFASQRLAVKLSISLCSMNSVCQSHYVETKKTKIEELALPICERAKEIELDFCLDMFRKTFTLRPPQNGGSFSALTDLTIACARMDGGELGRFVSFPQCPRLRKLVVDVSKLAPGSDVSMRSESLECLDYFTYSINAKLEVTAPMLREITLLSPDEACIVAPKLEKIDWHGAFDPGRHQLAVASRHLQSLSIMHWSSFPIPNSSTRLMERFDSATEMAVSLFLSDKDLAGYVTFLKEMDKLPVCETLIINLMRSWDNHGLLPKMLYLLRRCSCIKKLKLSLSRHTQSKISSYTTLGCPCLLLESYRSDDITLDSLEVIGISSFTGSAEQLEFIEVLLSRCNMVTLKRLDITVSSTPVSSESMEFVERIHTMYSKVQLNVVLPREVPKPLAS